MNIMKEMIQLSTLLDMVKFWFTIYDNLVFKILIPIFDMQKMTEI